MSHDVRCCVGVRLLLSTHLQRVKTKKRERQSPNGEREGILAREQDRGNLRDWWWEVPFVMEHPAWRGKTRKAKSLTSSLRFCWTCCRLENRRMYERRRVRGQTNILREMEFGGRSFGHLEKLLSPMSVQLTIQAKTLPRFVMGPRRVKDAGRMISATRFH